MAPARFARHYTPHNMDTPLGPLAIPAAMLAPLTSLPQGLGFGPVEVTNYGTPYCMVFWRGQRVGVLTRHEHNDIDTTDWEPAWRPDGAEMLHVKGAASYTITGTITHGALPFAGLCPYLLLAKFAAELVAWELLGCPASSEEQQADAYWRNLGDLAPENDFDSRYPSWVYTRTLPAAAPTT